MIIDFIQCSPSHKKTRSFAAGVFCFFMFTVPCSVSICAEVPETAVSPGYSAPADTEISEKSDHSTDRNPSPVVYASDIPLGNNPGDPTCLDRNLLQVSEAPLIKEQDKTAADNLDPDLFPLYISPDLSGMTSEEESARMLAVQWARIEKNLNCLFRSCSGKWSVYLKDLTYGKTMYLNESTLTSASLIKLYIAGAVLEAAEKKELEWNDSVEHLLEIMISESDNTAANDLVLLLSGPSNNFRSGLIKVNSFIRRNGFSDTWQYNGLSNESLIFNHTHFNRTSAGDCGVLLEMIWNRSFVSEDASEKMLKWLGNQQTRYKIPDAVPPEITIYNKTGETSLAQHDAAILSGKDGDYILCILSDKQEDPNAAIDLIRSAAKMIHPEMQSYEKLCAGMASDN